MSFLGGGRVLGTQVPLFFHSIHGVIFHMIAAGVFGLEAEKSRQA